MKARIIETENGFYAQIKPFIKWKTLEKFKYPFPGVNSPNIYFVKDKLPAVGEKSLDLAIENLNEYAKRQKKSTFQEVRLEKEI